MALLFAPLCLFIIGLIRAQHRPSGPRQAFNAGLQWATDGRLVPDIWLDLAVLAIAVVSIRSIWLALLSFRTNSPIEVKPLDNATRNSGIDTHRLDVTFGDYIALSRLYRIPTVPGDQEPDRLIEVLNAPVSKGWAGLLSAVVAYAFPRRAFLVTASLLDRDGDQGCGVSLQVRRFPGLPVHLETQWSKTFERALQRGAYAVAAYITQQTRACQRIPWSEWGQRKRPLPASLFRDYQRAKKMVRERRYDEALELYHSALRQDAGNIGMRYDIGQLYERLRLYPDALLSYMGLVDEIFPVKKFRHIRPGNHRFRNSADNVSRLAPIRVTAPRWWPRRTDKDPFVIRYRYIVILGQANLVARGLVSPQLQPRQDQNANSGVQQATPDSKPEGREDRPWRTIEVGEIGRLISTQLDLLYSEYSQQSLAQLIQETGYNAETRAREISRYLLMCAEHEAEMLIQDLEGIHSRTMGLRSSRKSVLTATAVRQAQLTIRYRLRKLDWQQGQEPEWPVELDTMENDLLAVGYSADRSENWLEHYNAACYYALVVVDDKEEHTENARYAFRAVAALERATLFGEQVEFVMSKKYWLQAGDPDLSGLRSYECFRAFEARIYGHPLPATADFGRYEQYRFIRAILRRAARDLENTWRGRKVARPQQVTYAEFEEWWRQELRAWEMAIRLGRFHTQWQTRHAVLEAIRNWTESYGPEALPIPYPNLAVGDYLTDMGDPALVQQIIDKTREILDFLATRCGRLVPSMSTESGNLFDKTRLWNRYATYSSRSGAEVPESTIVKVCLERAALWASLRQWTQYPEEGQRENFEELIFNLSDPPPLR